MVRTPWLSAEQDCRDAELLPGCPGPQVHPSFSPRGQVYLLQSVLCCRPTPLLSPALKFPQLCPAPPDCEVGVVELKNSFTSIFYVLCPKNIEGGLKWKVLTQYWCWKEYRVGSLGLGIREKDYVLILKELPLCLSPVTVDELFYKCFCSSDITPLPIQGHHFTNSPSSFLSF